MKSRKINYVVVGGFVIAMLTALTFSIALLSGHSGETEDYYVVYDNVSGVGFGTKVLFEGYHVGQVEDITPAVEDGVLHFRLDMSIVKGWHIPVDSVARKESGGLLSAVTIAISAGESIETLEPGSQINSGASTSLFDVVSQVASDAGDVTRTGLKPLLENINKQVALLGVMLEEDIPVLLGELSATASVAAERAPVILANLETFTENLDEILSARNIALVNSSLENIEEGTGNFVAIAGDLQTTSANIDRMIASINEVVSGNKDNVDKTLVDLRYSMESVARHVDAISRNLEGSSRHMYEFSRQIRLNPGLLLGGKPPRDEAETAAGGGR